MVVILGLEWGVGRELLGTEFPFCKMKKFWRSAAEQQKCMNIHFFFLVLSLPFILKIFMAVQLIYNVVLISGVQPSVSVIRISTYEYTLT